MRPVPTPDDDARPVAPSGVADADLLPTWRAFRTAATAVDHRLRAAVAALPVRPQLVEALALLVAAPTGRLTMTRLATLLDVTSGGLTEIVDQLVRDDLVHRQPAGSDSRVVFAVLTDRGQQVVTAATPLHTAQLLAELEQLPPHRLADVRSTCRALLEGHPRPPGRAREVVGQDAGAASST